MNMNSPELFGD